MKNNQKGIATALIIVIALVIIIGGVSLGWYISNLNKETNANVSTNTTTKNENLNQNLNVALNQNTNTVTNTDDATNVNINTNSAAQQTNNEFSFATAKAGDKVGAMTITKIGSYYENRPDVSPNRRVEFSGQVTLTGKINNYFSDFGGTNLICMGDFDTASLASIPIFDDLNLTVSFCFDNYSQAVKIYPSGVNKTDTVIIDNYVLISYPSEIFNTVTFIQQIVSTKDWQGFASLSMGFEIRYPNDWKKLVGNTPDTDNTYSVALGPESMAEDYIFSILIVDNIPILGDTSPNQVVTKIEDTTFKGVSAKKITTKNLSLNQEWSDIYIPRNDTFLKIGPQPTINNSDFPFDHIYNNTIQEIINSFIFLS